jgi:hypothetical protein
MIKALFSHLAFTKQAKARQLFKYTFTNINGFKISKSAQTPKQLKQARYTYGEVMYASFCDLLKMTNPQKNDVFCDLGSGIGKAVIIASMQHPFSKAYGIELIKELHQTSLERITKFHAHRFTPSVLGATKLAFYNKDLLTHDLSSINVLYVNATAFIGDFWEDVHQHLKSCKSGTRVILVSKRLDPKLFKEIAYLPSNMTWGFASVFVYIKK